MAECRPGQCFAPTMRRNCILSHGSADTLVTLRWSRAQDGRFNFRRLIPEGRLVPTLYGLYGSLADGRCGGTTCGKATLRPAEWRVLDAVTQLPVPDLSGLSITDVELIGEENAFDFWRRELSGVVVETEDVTSNTRDAAAIAAERLAAGARQIERTIIKSPALSAMRSGLSTLAVAGSAVLASFLVLSVEGRTDALSLAVGSSLVDTGRRLVSYERRCSTTALESARSEHYRAAATVFAARATRAAGT